MRIMYVNNDGGGFADYIDLDENTTVGQLFTQRIPHGRPGDYLIRVNRQPTTADYVLQEGDRVSITPSKIEGASPHAQMSPAKGELWELGNSSIPCTWPTHFSGRPSSAVLPNRGPCSSSSQS